MNEVTYLSKSAFAAHIGRSPSYITWLKENGRLVQSPNGKQVDVLAPKRSSAIPLIRARLPSPLAINRNGFSVMCIATSQPNPSRLTWLRRRPWIRGRGNLPTFRSHVRIASIIWLGWRRWSFARRRESWWKSALCRRPLMKRRARLTNR